MDAQDTLLQALSGISGTGHFHSAGARPFFFPGLMVEGAGEVAFPLAEGQARELIGLAEQAPFGKGTRTVLDADVRKCWQMDAAAFRFESPAWAALLAGIVQCITEDLGIRGQVSAVPYKLLIYGPGGHFKAHRDTEKLDAMFGSLIVALPSRHEGGRLLIRHDGMESVVDFSDPAQRNDFQFAAFFADCEHEVEPVRSGYRFCVAYNLRLDQGDAAVLNLPLTAQSRTLVGALENLKSARRGQLSAVLLEHSYTEANLALAHLKGNDQARALALLSAASASGFTAHLALVTFHQSGELEGAEDYEDYRYRRGGRGRHRGPDPNEGTMGEISDESLTISHWRDARDRPVELGEYQIAEEALISKEPISDGEPDEKESEGYTGNAGCTMDHWYRRAAIVLWAVGDEEEILCRQDLRGACGKLLLLAGGGRSTPPGAAFYRLARAAISRYPDELGRAHLHSAYQDYSGDPLRVLVASLAAAGARELLETLIRRLPASAYGIPDAALWAQLGKTFGPEVFDGIFPALLGTDPAQARQPLFQILQVLTALKDAARVRRIVPHLVRLTPQPVEDFYPYRKSGKEAPPVTEGKALLAASSLLESPVQRQAVLKFLQSDGTLDSIRKVLGPVLLDKDSKVLFKQENSLAPVLRAFVVKALTEETERPLHPFPNWARPCPAVPASPITPSFYSASQRKGDPLVELAAFMADPVAQTHAFTRVQHERDGIEEFIRRHGLDLDPVTIRKGSPHTLSCTKNSRSYQKRREQKANDGMMLKSCGAL